MRFQLFVVAVSTFKMLSLRVFLQPSPIGQPLVGVARHALKRRKNFYGQFHITYAIHFCCFESYLHFKVRVNKEAILLLDSFTVCANTYHMQFLTSKPDYLQDFPSCNSAMETVQPLISLDGRI